MNSFLQRDITPNNPIALGVFHGLLSIFFSYLFFVLSLLLIWIISFSKALDLLWSENPLVIIALQLYYLVSLTFGVILASRTMKKRIYTEPLRNTIFITGTLTLASIILFFSHLFTGMSFMFILSNEPIFTIIILSMPFLYYVTSRYITPKYLLPKKVLG